MRSRVADILVEIVERRRISLSANQSLGLDGLRDHVSFPLVENEFTTALRSQRGSAVIAEIKMGSPRLGSLADRVDPLEQARIYGRSGASALSVVVEPDYFLGSYELLRQCREESGLPVLAKDFVVGLEQLDWAAEAGADAVLLIAALYERHELQGLATEARRRGLAPLVETHDRRDVDLLNEVSRLATEGPSGWEMTGVNHRDLRTFEVELDVSTGLIDDLPTEAVRVAESGIRGKADMDLLASRGFEAFLIGEALLLATNPGALLVAMTGGASE